MRMKSYSSGEVMENNLRTIKRKLLKVLELYFGNDTRIVNHTKEVMSFVEKLLEKEEGDRCIVIPATILHDIGIKAAERKYGSSAPGYQEKEGQIAAREILLEMELKQEDVDEICQIIAHHHSPGKTNTRNFKLVYDADWLVNLRDEVDIKDKVKLRELIDKIFLTNSGKKLAYKVYLQNKS